METKEKNRTANVQKGIVFVADHWCSYTGGIDVFNQKLCEAMAYVVEQSKVKIVCLVLGTVATRDIRMADEKKGIRVIEYKKRDVETDSQVCEGAEKHVRREIPNTKFIWVGHDLKTGEIALRMAKINNEKCAIIFHTDYISVHANRNDWEQRRKEGTDNIKRDERQIDLAEKADWIFCVGPMLYETFKGEQRDNIFMIIPGLEENEGKKPMKRNIITIAGTYSKTNAEQKNWENACIATVKALNRMPPDGISPAEFQIIVCGFKSEYTDEERKRLRHDLIEKLKKEEKVERMPAIQFKKFEDNRELYLRDIAKSRILIMSSEIETFGLVAWEGIALEVPIIISKASGIYKYLNNELGYMLNGLCGLFDSTNQESSESMEKVIANILRNREKMKKSTRLLRNEMKKNKWYKLAIDMANHIGVTEVMSADIFEDHDYAEFTYARRDLLLNEFKRRFGRGEIEKQIVFFDGVSEQEILKDENFLMSILELLEKKEHPDLKLFFCYEIDEAINQRHIEIKENEEVNKNSMHKKSEKLANLKLILIKLYREEMKYDSRSVCDIETELNRVHLVPLKKCPSVYINILDDDWYFTQKYQNRTSQNPTEKLSKEKAGILQKKRLIEHMKFILSDTEEDAECKLLLKEIEMWEKEIELNE